VSKVVVYHSEYGCDTGCCGHVVIMDDEDKALTFSHPFGDDPLGFARDLVRSELGEEHVADLDWDNCFVVDH
jgi:hypothetical protein